MEPQEGSLAMLGMTPLLSHLLPIMSSSTRPSTRPRRVPLAVASATGGATLKIASADCSAGPQAPRAPCRTRPARSPRRRRTPAVAERPCMRRRGLRVRLPIARIRIAAAGTRDRSASAGRPWLPAPATLLWPNMLAQRGERLRPSLPRRSAASDQGSARRSWPLAEAQQDRQARLLARALTKVLKVPRLSGASGRRPNHFGLLRPEDAAGSGDRSWPSTPAP